MQEGDISLIVLPGIDGLAEFRAEFVRRMSEQMHTTAISYPTDASLGYDELTRMVRALLPTDHPYLLLAESFSGPVAVRIAAEPPEGLRGIVLCGTFIANPRPILGRLAGVLNLLPVKAIPRRLLSLLMLGRWATPDGRVNLFGALSRVSDELIKSRLKAVIGVDATDAARSVTLPALVIAATSDRLLSGSAARTTLKHFPHATVEFVEGPHWLLQAVPEKVADAVKRFVLDRLVTERGPL